MVLLVDDAGGDGDGFCHGVSGELVVVEEGD